MTDRKIWASKAGWVGPALVLAGAVCIGFAPIGLRLGLGELGPQAVAFWRYVFATPLVLMVVLLVNGRLPARPDRYAVMAGIFFGLDIAFWHAGLTLTTVANATFLVNLGNIGAGLLAWAVLRDRPAAAWFAGVPIAVIGAALLTLGGGSDGASDIRGDGLALIAAALVAGYTVSAMLARRTLSALDVLFWVTVVETGVAFLATLTVGESFWPDTHQGWLAPLALAVFVQLGGQGLIIAGLGYTAPSMAGILLLMQPVVAAFLSWRLFNETLVTWQFAGAFLILLGVGVAQLRRSISKPS